jgi:SHS2 domain-containing protein
MTYRELDHTADILLEVTGTSIHELFCEAARALMEILYPPKKTSAYSFSPHILDIVSIPIAVNINSGEEKNENTDKPYESYELLVQAFLSELLFLTETEYIVFSKYDITIEPEKIYGVVQGVAFDPALHCGGIGVKGISYSDLTIQERENTYILTIIFDI